MTTAETTRLLKAYLDDIGFHGIYKYVTSYQCYYATPHMVGRAHRDQFERFDQYIRGRGAPHALLGCLMMCRGVDAAALGREELVVADALVGEGILRIEEGRYHGDRFQLISYLDTYLLIDARINFPQFGINELYVGVDTYLMLYYLGTETIRRESRTLDLCTGSGIGALALSRFSEQVVAVDVDDAALALAGFNIALNGKAGAIDLRNEDLRDTLDGNHRYDVITCNPPYVPVPDGYGLSIFAAGPGPDGQDYVRLLIGQADRFLTEEGCGYYVTVLPGDDEEPYFLREVEDFCRAGDLAVDAFLDGGLPADRQIAFLAPAMRARNQSVSETQATAALTELLVDRLGARRFYCCTFRVRRDAKSPGLRTFNRSLPRDPMTVPVTEWLQANDISRV